MVLTALPPYVVVPQGWTMQTYDNSTTGDRILRLRHAQKGLASEFAVTHHEWHDRPPAQLEAQIRAWIAMVTGEPMTPVSTAPPVWQKMSMPNVAPPPPIWKKIPAPKAAPPEPTLPPGITRRIELDD